MERLPGAARGDRDSPQERERVDRAGPGLDGRHVLPSRLLLSCDRRGHQPVVPGQPDAAERLVLALRTLERGCLRGVRVPHLVDRPADGPRIRRPSNHRGEPRWDRERTGGRGAAHRGGVAVLLFVNVVFLGLAIAGAGFFVWYAIVAWRNFRGLIDRFRPPTRAVAIPGPQTPYFSTMPPPVATPPDPGQPPPSAQMWPVTPSVGPPAVAVRNASRIPREYTPSYVPPPYGYPPVRFQCPYCAWVEAKYDAGRFTCTRCGRTA